LYQTADGVKELTQTRKAMTPDRLGSVLYAVWLSDTSTE